MKKRVLVPLAEGFEELEAVTIVDVLRRAGLEVVLAALHQSPVTGSRGVALLADAMLADQDPDSFDAICLPGGMDGTLAMMEDEHLISVLRRVHGAGHLTAAICAAPMVLVQAGLGSRHELTSHPGVMDRLGDARVNATARVLRSGNVLTSQGPGTAMEFALTLVEVLCGEDVRSDLALAMVVSS